MPLLTRLSSLSLLWILWWIPTLGEAEVSEQSEWQAVVRASPYWVSKGAFANLKTIRRWVLNGEAYCEKKHRHILFDKSASFLGYFDDAEDPAATQVKLNRTRERLAREGRVDHWVAGSAGRAGYPFALSCDQPEAQLAVALARYFGKDETARLWGTWDGMRIGATDAQVSLHKAFALVYADRVANGRVTLPEEVLATLAGKALIESGGQKVARSHANARGIMQLSPAALRDCGLASRFYFHRLAQIDCALKLMEQNHRNLKPAFDAVFGELPKDQAEPLYQLLLIQAYHGGVGRVSGLLTKPDIKRTAEFFARYHRSFTPGDIALGLVFHNLGREALGFASLYYLADTAVATELACEIEPTMAGCGLLKTRRSEG